MSIFKGLSSHGNTKAKKSEDSDESPQMPQSELTLNIINRLMRKNGLVERTGVANVLNQLEITPIPTGSVIPITNSVNKAAILDSERIKMRIPLVYVWLETYLLAQKGAKRFIFILKDLAAEQVAGKEEIGNAGIEEG